MPKHPMSPLLINHASFGVGRQTESPTNSRQQNQPQRGYICQPRVVRRGELPGDHLQRNPRQQARAPVPGIGVCK